MRTTHAPRRFARPEILAALSIVLSLSAATGCGGARPRDLKSVASRDMSCPERQLRIKKHGNARDIIGCGQNARYVLEGGAWHREGAQPTSAQTPAPAGVTPIAQPGTQALVAPAAATGPVTVNGRPMVEPELTKAAEYFGRRPAAGDWWYDSKSGLFGGVGHGTQGVLRAGFPVAPLQRTASYGASGVLVNGREITRVERDYLISIFRGDAQHPEKYEGSYELDAQGNLTQGGRLLGNVAQAAKASQGTGGTWHSKNGAMGGSSPGCSWVYIPNSTTQTSTSVMSGCE